MKKIYRELKNRYVMVFLAFSIVIMPQLLIPSAMAQEEAPEEVWLFSGDLIRNFKFESFGGQEILQSGQLKGQHLNFAHDTVWRLNSSDVEVVQKVTGSKGVSFRYFVKMTHDMYIYTSVPLSSAVSHVSERTLGDFSFPSGIDALQKYYLFREHQYMQSYYIRVKSGLFCCCGGSQSGYLHFNYLDLGNIVSYNRQNHKWSGDLKMSFDIDDQPMPQTVVDNAGVEFAKQFDYVSIHSARIEEQSVGRLSDDIPTFDAVLPEEQSMDDITSDQADVKGNTYIQAGSEPSATVEGVIANSRPSVTVGRGARFQDQVIPAVVGSSLNPLDKNGDDLFNATDERSLQNATLSYNVGAISPLVQQWDATLRWDYKRIIKCDTITDIGEWTKESGEPRSKTKPVGWSVNNRYIKVKLAVIFDIWTGYNIVGIDDPDIISNILGQPQEYYDNLAFRVTIDGVSGGYVQIESTPLLADIFDFLFGDIFGIILFAIVVIIIIIILISVIRGRGRRKRQTITFRQARSLPAGTQQLGFTGSIRKHKKFRGR